MHGIWQSKVYRICLLSSVLCLVCARQKHGIWNGVNDSMMVKGSMWTYICIKYKSITCQPYVWHIPGIRIWILSCSWHMHSITLTYDDLVRMSDICHVQPLWVCSVPVAYLDHGWMYNAYARHMPGICRVVYAWVAYAWRVAHDWHMPIVRYLYALHMKYATYMPGLLAYIRHMPCLCSMPCICQIYTCLTYTWHMTYALTYTWHMTYARHMPDIIYARYMPDTCLAYIWHITYSRHMPGICQMWSRTATDLEGHDLHTRSFACGGCSRGETSKRQTVGASTRTGTANAHDLTLTGTPTVQD